MYHDVSARIMWEVEPTLYWRVKRNGKWRYERARFVRCNSDDAEWHTYTIEPPYPPCGLQEGE